jgi:hypothetical protein
MAEILLFHHAQGQTPVFLAFADELRAVGHGVHAPDLYDGKTFTDLDEASVTRRRLASRRLESAVDSPPMGYRTSLSMPGSRLARCPRRSLSGRAPAATARCCFTPLSRRPSSGLVAAWSSAPDPHDGG